MISNKEREQRDFPLLFSLKHLPILSVSSASEVQHESVHVYEYRKKVIFVYMYMPVFFSCRNPVCVYGILSFIK